MSIRSYISLVLFAAIAGAVLATGAVELLLGDTASPVDALVAVVHWPQNDQIVLASIVIVYLFLVHILYGWATRMVSEPVLTLAQSVGKTDDDNPTSNIDGTGPEEVRYLARVVRETINRLRHESHLNAEKMRSDNDATRRLYQAETARHHRAETQIKDHRRALRLLTAGAPLDEVLGEIIDSIGKNCPGSRYAILLYDPDSSGLQHAATSGVPDDFCGAIDGTQAALLLRTHEGEEEAQLRLVSQNIPDDPDWAAYRDLAAQHKLISCWTCPIRTLCGDTAGVLAVYNGKPADPDDDLRYFTEAGAELAAHTVELRHGKSTQKPTTKQADQAGGDTQATPTGTADAKHVNQGPNEETASKPQTETQDDRCRILLAESNELSQMVAANILHNAGYACDVASHGGDAVSLFKSRHYDLVLMSCKMPHTDGYEAARRIRELEDAARTPIIALTSTAQFGNHDRCREAGMDDCLAKPFDSAELLGMIRNHLRRSTDPGTLPGAGTTTPGLEELPMPDQADGVQRTTSPSQVSQNAAPRKPHPDGTQPPIDMDQALHRCMGNTAFLDQVLAKFREQSTQDLRQLAELADGGDATQIAEGAHRLRENAATVAAITLCEHAAELEDLGRAGTLDDTVSRIDAIKAELKRCLSYLTDPKDDPKGA